MGKFADTGGQVRVSGQVGTFIRLIPEYPTVLFILENPHQEDPLRAHMRWTHWLPKAQRISGQRGYSVTCPGPQICPVCLSNQKIKNASDGRNYRNHKDYISAVKRYLTNVFDITEVKKCDCGAIYFPQNGEFLQTCGDASCEADLTNVEPEPLKRIRVLEGSATVFNNFNSFQDSVRDENDQPIDLRDYPIMFMVSGRKTQKTISPVPQIMSRYKRPTEEDFTLPDGSVQEPYNLVELTKPFSPDEVLHLMEGGSVRDIFESREESSLDDEKIPW